VIILNESVAVLIITDVLLVDKLLNKPDVLVVPGIIQLSVVPCIVTVDLIPVNAVVPTVTVVDSVYPKLIVVRLEQSLNALVPILDTLAGILTDIIAVEPLKALLPIVIILNESVAVLIITDVLLVDKLLNKPDVDVAPGIIQLSVVPCIVTVDLIPVNAVAPTEVSTVPPLYPKLIVARLEQY